MAGIPANESRTGPSGTGRPGNRPVARVSSRRRPCRRVVPGVPPFQLAWRESYLHRIQPRHSARQEIPQTAQPGRRSLRNRSACHPMGGRWPEERAGPVAKTLARSARIGGWLVCSSADDTTTVQTLNDRDSRVMASGKYCESPCKYARWAGRA